MPKGRQKRNKKHKTHAMSANPRTLLKRVQSVSRANKIISVGVVLLVAALGYTYITSLAAVVRTSVKSGNWSDASVWGGTVPQTGEAVTIAPGHTVTYNVNNSTVAGVTINEGGVLTFDPDKTTTLNSSENFIVRGKLVMKPSSPSNIQTLKFVNVDESKFVGGGMEPLTTDVGLWVVGLGQLDIQGADKLGWTRAAGGISQGATSITLKEIPTGWQVGDEISITPTQAPTAGSGSWNGFDEAVITAISDKTVTLDKATNRPHPQVNDKWTAEVMNLTRNVRIEGGQNTNPGPSTNGRAHILVRSGNPQTVNHAAIRYMGPRQHSGDFTGGVLGRYGLHFHHSHEGTRGTTIEGTVVRDVGNHSFVPHGSHGITFKQTISYNSFDDAYWWDPGDATHDTMFDETLAAKVRSDPAFRGYRLSGYNLGIGDGNAVRNAVAVGVQGNVDASGFQWPESGSGTWDFSSAGNVAHNNAVDGIFIWQNTDTEHIIENFTAYHNGEFGIDHGAYVNRYIYNNLTLYGNRSGGIKMQAVSKEGLRFSNLDIDGAGFSEAGIYAGHHNGDTNTPTEIRNANIRNHTKASIWINGEPGGNNKDLVDVINSTLEPNEFYIGNNVNAASRIRVQPNSGQPFELRRADQSGGTLVSAWNAKRTNISKFAPETVGTGTGLRGEYYDDTSYSKLVSKHIDGIIDFSWWNEGVPYYGITPETGYSIRWTGQIQPQYSETYTFYLSTSNAKVWVNDQLVVQYGGYPSTKSGQIALQANQKYDIKIEFSESSGFRPTISLEWASPSLPRQLVTRSQLYPAAFTHEDETPPPSGSDDHDGHDMESTDPDPISDQEPEPESEPTPPPVSNKEGDLNSDGKVNILDLSILLANWNKTTDQIQASGHSPDLNGDGRVDILDLSILLKKWGS